MASGEELLALRRALKALGYDKDFITDVAQKYGEVEIQNWAHMLRYLEELGLTEAQIKSIIKITQDMRPGKKA